MKINKEGGNPFYSNRRPLYKENEMKRLMITLILASLILLGDYAEATSYDDTDRVVEAMKLKTVAISEVITDGNLIDTYAYKLAYKTISAHIEQCLGSFTATAYCNCEICCGSYATSSPSITASGAYCQQGRTISVDPNVIPLGTEVIVEYQDGSRATYVAEDTGSAIKGNRLDVYFSSHEEACRFGRQEVTVYIP